MSGERDGFKIERGIKKAQLMTGIGVGSGQKITVIALGAEYGDFHFLSPGA